MSYHLLYDASQPSLIEEIDIPSYPQSFPFVVEKYNGESVGKNDFKIHASNCYISIAKCLNYVIPILSQVVPNTKWNNTEVLTVKPLAGNSFNAFYTQGSVQYFYKANPILNRICFISDSVSAVCHELGHAILDSFRPEFFNIGGVEIWGFHEAFSDITGLIGLSQSDLFLDAVMKEINGNLRKSNMLSRIAQDAARTLYDLLPDKKGRDLDCLRDGTKVFYYPKQQIPSNGTWDVLTYECHSFSRIFFSAWYEIFVRIFEKNKSIKEARDIAYQYLLQAAVHAPKAVSFFKSVASLMCSLSKKDQSPYTIDFENVFSEWGLADSQNIENNLNKIRKISGGNSVLYVVKNGTDKSMLNTAEIELPDEELHEDKGNFKMAKMPDCPYDNFKIVSKSINEDNPFNENLNSRMWTIENGKWKRNYF